MLDELVSGGITLIGSEVVRFELLAGTRPDDAASVERFLEAIEWVPITETVTRAAAHFARSFRRSHSGIDTADYLIAATASLLDAPLLTANLRHFPMLEGLERPY